MGSRNVQVVTFNSEYDVPYVALYTDGELEIDANVDELDPYTVLRVIMPLINSGSLVEEIEIEPSDEMLDGSARWEFPHQLAWTGTDWIPDWDDGFEETLR